MIAIRDISDKGRKQHKRLHYEVLEVLAAPKESDNYVGDLVAKFRNYGDARLFAEFMAKGNVWMYEILVR